MASTQHPRALRAVAVVGLGLASTLPACGASLTAQERAVAQTFADARRDAAAFAAHFDPALAPGTLASWQASFAREAPPKFEQGRGPVCVRAYWGEYVIDHSYFLYLRGTPGGFVITEVVYDSGFGPALGSLGGTEHRARPPSEYERCLAANAAARGR